MNKKFFSIALLVSMIAFASNVVATAEVGIVADKVVINAQVPGIIVPELSAAETKAVAHAIAKDVAQDVAPIIAKDVEKSVENAISKELNAPVITKENIVVRGYNATKGALVSAKKSVVTKFNAGFDVVKKSTPGVKAQAGAEFIYSSVIMAHPFLTAAGTAVLAFATLYTFNIKNFRNFVNKKAANLKNDAVKAEATVVSSTPAVVHHHNHPHSEVIDRSEVITTRHHNHPTEVVKHTEHLEVSAS